MARIPDTELQRLKEEISVQRLVEASGVELRKGGKDLVGRCPFHEDDTASLVVTPAKNLWHCFGCQIGGGPIDWVIKSRGVSFRHAVELLRAELSGSSSLAAEGVAVVKRSTVRALPAPVVLDADDRALLAQTIDYYHLRLKDSAEAQAYLKARGLDHPELVATFRLGVADRTLGLRLPEKTRKDGAAIRARLQAIGLLRESGHEHFNGSLVVPVFDEAGDVAEVYGRKIRDDLRPGTPKHLYLPGPHAGVFNLAGVAAAGARPEGEREVILTEALIDAMTFWCAGFTNVTSAYGVEGFTKDILAAFKAHAIERVLIAYDRDDAGERAADKLGAQLIAEGFEVLRVMFPKGMDANDYARKMSPAEKALGLVLRQARWVGSGRRPAEGSAPVVRPEDGRNDSGPHDGGGPALAAKTGQVMAMSMAAAVSTPAAPEAPPAAVPEQILEALPEELQLPTGACTWRVRGWKKNPSPEAMRVNLQVRRVEAGQGSGSDPDATPDAVGYHMDTLDLYAARARAAFVRQAAIELGLSEESVKRELGAVLLRMETLQDALLARARGEQRASAVPVLSADEEAEALVLLRDPHLTERIVADLQRLGVVGEELNLLAAYLAAVSRKLDTPLAVLIQSTSAAGKSSLMDAVLALVPAEERIRYSAMTGLPRAACSSCRGAPSHNMAEATTLVSRTRRASVISAVASATRAPQWTLPSARCCARMASISAATSSGDMAAGSSCAPMRSIAANKPSTRCAANCSCSQACSLEGDSRPARCASWASWSGSSKCTVVMVDLLGRLRQPICRLYRRSNHMLLAVRRNLLLLPHASPLSRWRRRPLRYRKTAIACARGSVDVRSRPARPRQPAWTLARGAMWLRHRLGPNVFGAKEGSSLQRTNEAGYLWLPTANVALPVMMANGISRFAIQTDYLNTPRMLTSWDGLLAWL